MFGWVPVAPSLTSLLTPQAEITKKKAEVSKHTAGVKTLQREVQTAELELGRSFVSR